MIRSRRLSSRRRASGSRFADAPTVRSLLTLPEAVAHLVVQGGAVCVRRRDAPTQELWSVTAGVRRLGIRSSRSRPRSRNISVCSWSYQGQITGTLPLP